MFFSIKICTATIETQALKENKPVLGENFSIKGKTFAENLLFLLLAIYGFIIIMYVCGCDVVRYFVRK